MTVSWKTFSTTTPRNSWGYDKISRSLGRYGRLSPPLLRLSSSFILAEEFEGVFEIVEFDTADRCGHIAGINHGGIDAVFRIIQKCPDVLGKGCVKSHPGLDFHRDQLTVVVNDQIDFIPALHTEIIAASACAKFKLDLKFAQ